MDVSSFKGELSPEMQDVIMVLYPAFRALPFLALLAIGPPPKKKSLFQLQAIQKSAAGTPPMSHMCFVFLLVL